MADTERQNAAGKVLRHFTMSLDGFVAGPNHAMDWVTGLSIRPRLVEEYAETTGAVLGGRDGFDAYPLSAASTVARGRGLYSSLRTIAKRAAHQRRDFLSCDVAEVIRIGLEAAGGKNGRSSRLRSADSTSSAN